MCDVCVTEAVKQRMLSRRELFMAAPVLAAATVLAPAALAATPSKVYDLTHTISPEFPTYFGKPGISFDKKFDFKANGFNLYEMTLNEHTGTHVDAPLHFSADGHSVDAIPVTDLVVPLVVVDIREKAAAQVDAQLTPDDLKAWIAKHGPLPERCCVAMLSGWDAHVGSPKFRGADDKGTQHYPGFHVEAAKMMIEQASVVGIASDSLSLDIGSSADFATHYAWLPTNRWGIECIKGLADLPATGATLVVGAPKHAGGSGGPARVLALV